MAGMGARDIYAEVAFFYLMFICDKCSSEGRQTTLELEHLGDGHGYDEKGFDKLLGNEARTRGWHVGDKGDDYLVLCPECAMTPHV